MRGFSTKAIHGPPSGQQDHHGSLRPPIYDSVAYEHPDSRTLQDVFAGRKPGHVYSRITNPTVQDFEQKIKLLTDGRGVVAVASGMAAISNTILALGGAGKNIVTTKFLFGNTLSLLEQTLSSWGLEIKFVQMTNLDSVEKAIDQNTVALFAESMTNPQLVVTDFAKLSELTRKHAIPLVVDNTVMTPYLFQSKSAGVDIEILSTTKYISGGATSVGGVIIDTGNYDWKQAEKMSGSTKKFGQMAFLATLRQEVFRNVGACLSPHNAYLQSLGLETMALRIDKSCRNAMRIAGFLKEHSKVQSVHYPGLVDSPFFQTANKLFAGSFGGILTFDLHNEQDCFPLMDALQLIKRATNINDNKTLILHPSSTIFAEYFDQEKSEMGIRPTMIRLSAGIEDIDDLIDDLQKGLDSI